jgi:hypothetical protein
MKRLLITEEEKKKILGLYGLMNEQSSLPNEEGIYFIWAPNKVIDGVDSTVIKSNYDKIKLNLLNYFDFKINEIIVGSNSNFNTPSGQIPFFGVYDNKNKDIVDLTSFLTTNVNKTELKSKLTEIYKYYSDFEQYKIRLLPILEEAKNWWRKWLSNPTIRTKFKKIHSYLTDTDADNIYNKYFNRIDMINSINVDLDIKTSACAYVTNKPNQININLKNEICKEGNDADWKVTFVHEIQHLLYKFFPLTTDKSITNFRNDDGCFKKNREIYNNVDVAESDKLLKLKLDKNKIDEIANDLGLDYNKTNHIIKQILKYTYQGWDEEYFYENNDELASRVIGTKSILLNNTEGTELTKDDFLKLLKTNNIEQINEQIKYVLGYWATRGFEPLENFVNLLNTSFVKVDKKTPSKSNIETMG